MKRGHDTPGVRPGSDHHLAEVTSVADVHSLGRIEVRLLAYDGVDTQDAVLTARLCVPAAGPDRGTFFCPSVGDEVLVLFVNGDPRQAVVMGSMWHGSAAPPETLGGNRRQVDRWSVVGAKGTRIAIEEEGESGALVKLSTKTSTGSEPSSIVINRNEGGFIELSAGGTTVRLSSEGLSVQTSGDVTIQGSSATVTAPTVDLNAASTYCAGTFESQISVSTTAVDSMFYSTGVGNIW